MAAAKVFDTTDLFTKIVKDESLAAKYEFSIVLKTDHCLVLSNVPKFASAALHLLVISKQLTASSIKELGSQDVAALETMATDGIAAMRQLDAKRASDGSTLVMGFTDPPAIRRLHLHVLCPPLSTKSTPITLRPSWRPYKLVLDSLK